MHDIFDPVSRGSFSRCTSILLSLHDVTSVESRDWFMVGHEPYSESRYGWQRT